MPIYEYQCGKGHLFEEIQSFTAPHVTRCPECGLKAKRKISLASFHLKGSGWYSKDSASAGKRETRSATTEKKEPEEKKAPDDRQDVGSVAGAKDSAGATAGTEKTPSETSSDKSAGEKPSKPKKEKTGEKKTKAESSKS